MRNEEPKIQNLTSKQVAFISYKGNYIGNPKIFEDLFNKLGGWANPKGLISPETIFLSSYKDDPKVTPPEELTVEVCMTVPENTEVEGEIKKKMLPGGEYAILHAEIADPKEYGSIWNKVVEWAISKNWGIDMSRPSYEIYLNNPEEHPEKHHIIDICLSVKKADA